jgi:hypothetical protein
MTQTDEATVERSTVSSRSPGPDGESLLLTYLRGRDVACPVCGYNLRDLTRPVCPECAEPLSLTVRAAERPIWPFILAMTPGLFSCVSFVLFTVFLCYLVPRAGLPPRWWWPFALEAFGVASMTFAAVLYRRRRVFLLLSIATQLIWAAGIWIVHVTAAALALLIGPA